VVVCQIGSLCVIITFVVFRQIVIMNKRIVYDSVVDSKVVVCVRHEAVDERVVKSHRAGPSAFCPRSLASRSASKQPPTHHAFKARTHPSS